MKVIIDIVIYFKSGIEIILCYLYYIDLKILVIFFQKIFYISIRISSERLFLRKEKKLIIRIYLNEVEFFFLKYIY